MSSVLALLVLLAPGILASGNSSRPAQVAQAPTADLSIKTYNVNFGLAGDGPTLAAIGEGAPDLILLQETTQAWEDAIRAEYAAAYPYQDFIEGPGAGGMGVLSRHPITTGAILLSPIGWFPAWLLTVRAPAGDVQILQVHLVPPYAEHGGFVVGFFTSPRGRLKELSAYLPYLDPTLPTVVAGDFNERAGPALGALATAGFLDALPRGMDTWRWTVAGITLDAPLDHVFCNAAMQVVSAEVQPLGRSDHLPVMVGFALR